MSEHQRILLVGWGWLLLTQVCNINALEKLLPALQIDLLIVGAGWVVRSTRCLAFVSSLTRRSPLLFLSTTTAGVKCAKGELILILRNWAIELDKEHEERRTSNTQYMHYM